MVPGTEMVAGGLVIPPLQTLQQRSRPFRERLGLKEEAKEVKEAVARVTTMLLILSLREEGGEDLLHQTLCRVVQEALPAGMLSPTVRPRPHPPSGHRLWSIFKRDFEGTELTGRLTGTFGTGVTITGDRRW